MALRQAFSVKVDGLQPFLRRLQKVEKRSTRRAILKAAMQAGTNPIKRALRTEIKSAGAVRKGHMRKGVASAVRVYNSGVAIIITGIRWRKLPDGENPGNYFHLVDLGVRPHAMQGGTSGKVTHPVYVEDIGEYRQVPKRVSYRHPGFFGYAMKRAAEQRSWPQVQDAVMDKFEQRLRKELV